MSIQIQIGLENDAEDIYCVLNRRKDFFLVVHNLQSQYLSQVRLELTGPPEVKIRTKIRQYNGIRNGNQKNRLFSIIPKAEGIFTLTAILSSNNIVLLTLPFEVKVGNVQILRRLVSPQIPLNQERTGIKFSMESSAGCCFLIIGFILVAYSISWLGMEQPLAQAMGEMSLFISIILLSAGVLILVSILRRAEVIRNEEIVRKGMLERTKKIKVSESTAKTLHSKKIKVSEPTAKTLYLLRVERVEGVINYLCGNCKNKDFLKVINEDLGFYHCLNCGADNYLKQ